MKVKLTKLLCVLACTAALFCITGMQTYADVVQIAGSQNNQPDGSTPYLTGLSCNVFYIASAESDSYIVNSRVKNDNKMLNCFPGGL